MSDTPKPPKYNILAFISGLAKVYAGLIVLGTAISLVGFFAEPQEGNASVAVGTIAAGMILSLFFLALSALIDLAMDCAMSLYRTNQLLEWVGKRMKP